MKKKTENLSKYQKFLLSIFSLSFVLIIVGGLSSFADGGSAGTSTSNDITSLTEKKIWNFYVGNKDTENSFVENGSKTSSTPHVYEGDTLSLEYKWEISSASTVVNEGKYFDVTLPEVQGLTIHEQDNRPLSVRIGSGTEPVQIGTFSVISLGSKKVVRTTFNNYDHSSTANLGGFITVTASAKKTNSTETITLEGLGSTTISLTVEENPGGSGGSGGGGNTPGHNPDSFKPIDNQPIVSKYADYKSYKNKDTIPFRIFVNKDQADEMYRGSFVDKTDLILVDELPDGLQFGTIDKHNFVFRIPFYAPAIDQSDRVTVLNKISDNEVLHVTSDFSGDYFTLPGVNQFIKLVKANNTQYADFASFKNNLVATAKSDSQATLGIYENRSMVLYYPKLRDDNITYDQIYGGEGKLTAAINGLTSDLPSNKKMTNAQKDKMLAGYTGNKPLVHFGIYFNTRIKETLTKPKTYVNHASLHWNNSKEMSTKKEVRVSDINNYGWLDKFNGSLKVIKTWVAEEQGAANFTLVDFESGKDVAKTLTLSKGTTEGSFNNLKKAFYTVRETGVDTDKFKVEIEPDYSKTPHEIHVKNIQLRDVTVKKVWVGSAAKPSSVRIHLVKKGDTTHIQTKEITLSGAGEFTHTFKKVPAFELDSSGQPVEIEYDIIEDAVTGFTSSTSTGADGVITLTNTSVATVPLKDIKVTKTWLNSKKADITSDTSISKPPVTVQLMEKVEGVDADFKEVTGKTLTLPKSDGSWTAVFTSLRAKDDANRNISYLVKETAKALGYLEGEVSGNETEGFVITNRQEIPKIDITAKKEWKNHENQADTASGKPVITVELLKKVQGSADFEKFSPSVTQVMEEKNVGGSYVWTATFSGLPLHDDDGRDIIYKVVETVVPEGYENTQVGLKENDYTLINKKKVVTIIPPGPTPPGPTPPGPTPPGPTPPGPTPPGPTPPGPTPPGPTPPGPTPPGPTPPGPTPPPTIPIDPYPIPLGPTPPMPTPEPPSEPIVPKVEIYEEPKEKVPSVPSLIPLTEEELDDIDVNGDDVPRGNTEIEEEIDGDDLPEGNTDIEEPEDAEISPDGLPRGRTKVRKELARTGGSENKLHSLMGVFAFLLLGCFAVFGFKKLR